MTPSEQPTDREQRETLNREATTDRIQSGNADDRTTQPAPPPIPPVDAGPTVPPPTQPPHESAEMPSELAWARFQEALKDRYTFIRKLLKGGMGEVWQAVQLSTRRDVALKVMREDAFESAEHRQRFEREIEIAASFEHPGIARVYESGSEAGISYYVMELVDGFPLDAFVHDRQLSRLEILELMHRVCKAVQFAHQNGVIHRDLKPANIMVTKDGQPKLLDFGLAKSIRDVAAEPAITVDGEALGTVDFMSPEQARGEVSRLDTRSDVYSLGVIILHLLTRQYPHGASGTYIKRMHRIAAGEVRRPCQIDPSLDREVDAILSKALALEPDRRYASAGELAEDLRRYISGEVVLARPHTAFYLLRKGLRRYRWQTATAAIALCSGLGILLFYVHTVQTRLGQEMNALVRENGLRQVVDGQSRLALTTLNELVIEVQKQPRDRDAGSSLRERLLTVVVDGLKNWPAGRTRAENEAADRGLAMAQWKVGDILLRAGQIDLAIDAYQTAIRQFESLAEAVGASRQAEQDLTDALMWLGRVRLRQGELGTARQILEQVKHKVQAAYDSGRCTSQDADNYWAVLIGLGDLMIDSGDPTAARGFFEEALRVTEQQIGVSKSSPGSLRRKAASLLRVAKAYVASGSERLDQANLAKARVVIDDAMSVARELLANSPKDTEARYDLSAALKLEGQIELREGRGSAATGALNRSLELAIELARQDPSRVDLQVNVASIYYLLGEAARQQGHSAEAADAYGRALGVLEPLKDAGTLASDAGALRLLTTVRERLQGMPSTRPSP